MAKSSVSEKRPWLQADKLVTAFFISWIFVFFVWHTRNYEPNRIASNASPKFGKLESGVSLKRQSEAIVEERKKVWISTSVCFSGNTKFFQKSHFPYLFSARLSADLWHRVTNASTIVQVIYDDVDKGNGKLTKFKQELEEGGSRVELVSSNGVSL